MTLGLNTILCPYTASINAAIVFLTVFTVLFSRVHHPFEFLVGTGHQHGLVLNAIVGIHPQLNPIQQGL